MDYGDDECQVRRRDRVVRPGSTVVVHDETSRHPEWTLLSYRVTLAGTTEGVVTAASTTCASVRVLY